MSERVPEFVSDVIDKHPAESIYRRVPLKGQLAGQTIVSVVSVTPEEGSGLVVSQQTHDNETIRLRLAGGKPRALPWCLLILFEKTGDPDNQTAAAVVRVRVVDPC